MLEQMLGQEGGPSAPIRDPGSWRRKEEKNSLGAKGEILPVIRRHLGL